MSLLVWLPLHGNLTNYGISPAKFSMVNSSGGLETTTAGKTGGAAYQRTKINTADYITSDISFTLDKDVSMACWCKITAHSTNNSANGIITQHGHSTGGLGITMRYISANDYRMSINTGLNGDSSGSSDRTYMTYYGNTNIYNAWHHLCVTYNHITKKIQMYVDGKLETIQGYGESITIAGNNSTARPFRLFDWSTDYSSNPSYKPNCLLNDVRLYDHCLNPREIKQISQGLILHFPLRDKGIEETTNVLTQPETPSRYVTSEYAWDQTLHNKAVNTGGWTHGYNGGVTNPTVGYHAHWQYIDNISTIVLPNINSLYGQAGRWLGITTPALQKKIGPSTTYTVSFDAKGSTDGMTIRSGYYYRINGASSNNFHDGQMDFTVNTSWKRYSYTYTTLSTLDTSVNAYIYFYGHVGIEGISYIRNIQVELKDHSTVFSKTTRNSNGLIDCSGYQRHGTVVGTLIPKEDGATSEICTYFSDGRYNYGASGTITMPTDAVTMSCWIKSSAIGYSSYHIPISFNSGAYEFSIDANGCFRNGFNINGSRVVDTTSHTSILDGKWHMITATYDGTTIRRYVDGAELTGYAKAITGTLAGSSSNLLLGNYNGTQYGNKEMCMNDVRIYSTALSAEDINTLYKASISFLNNNNIIAHEFKEEGSNTQLTEKGIIKSNVSELNYLNGMKIKTLSDGSAWARIFYHKNNAGATLFTSYDEVMYTNTTFKQSFLRYLNNLKSESKFEFLLNYTPLDTSLDYSNKYNRWKQTSNPGEEYVGTADSSLKATGYEAIHIDFDTNYWGGLTRQNSDATSISSCFISGSVGYSNWFHAIGTSSAWNGGIPGPNIAVEETELWLRIDTLPKTNRLSIFNHKYIQTPHICEI